jgi:hypothetical protein
VTGKGGCYGIAYLKVSRAEKENLFDRSCIALWILGGYVEVLCVRIDKFGAEF